MVIVPIRGIVEDTRLEANGKNKKKSEPKVKDSSSDYKPSRGQGLECSRPRPRTKDTNASVLKKKVFKSFFQAKNFFLAISKRGKQKRSSQNFRKFSGVFLHNFKNQKIPTIVETDANAHHIIWGSSATTLEERIC